MILSERKLSKNNIVGPSIGIWWYDPAENIVFSFCDDLNTVRPIAGVQNSSMKHLDLWKEVQRLAGADIPSYLEFKPLELPRGRVILDNGDFVVWCPPEFVDDADMRNQILQDFGVRHEDAMFISHPHYSLSKPSFWK